MPGVQVRDWQREAKEDTKGGNEEAKEGEEMKNKITNTEAVQAAEVLRKFCMQFTPQNSCDDCPFYWRDAPMRYNSCRLFKYPVDYNLRSAKKYVEAVKK